MGQSEYHLQISMRYHDIILHMSAQRNTDLSLQGSQGITKSISNSRDSKKNAMAQKNAQLCWIQKHTEEICNPLSGPPKKLNLTVYQMEEAWKE
ncbi:hypothetical protein T4E_12283 [Trichinella pseudospiralis]|uniref:Uncharacterized protein n=1 Tax=Trichinella pseudospiralis TaxID=6337 RepID=A0A0V0YH53_TRIPS|nr:hypothetical protein T4E_12283 [Trichinella pseudospiralis]